MRKTITENKNDLIANIIYSGQITYIEIKNKKSLNKSGFFVTF